MATAFVVFAHYDCSPPRRAATSLGARACSPGCAVASPTPSVRWRCLSRLRNGAGRRGGRGIHRRVRLWRRRDGIAQAGTRGDHAD
jgi:hypothetical protein